MDLGIRGRRALVGNGADVDAVMSWGSGHRSVLDWFVLVKNDAGAELLRRAGAKPADGQATTTLRKGKQ